MAIHTNSRIQLSSPSEYIRPKFQTIPAMGRKGTSGVLNGRGALGFFLRITRMLAHTITKANNVPMLVILPTTFSGRNAENGATKHMKSIFERQGVRHFGWISEKIFGTRPSRDIE